MIDIQKVAVEIDGRMVLDGINFSIEKNDFWLIFGPNGAGKTTLLRILAGHLPGFLGHVRLDDVNIRKISSRNLARRIAYLPQEEGIMLPMRVMDILLAGRYPHASLFKAYDSYDYKMVHEAIEFFELGPFLNRDISTLSGGERKKVFLASAFVQDVSVFLLDEPLNFLDPGASLSVIRMLNQLREKQKTVVVVSHYVEYFFPHVNKMLALKDGKMEYAGEKIFSTQIFQDVFHVSYGKLNRNGRDVLYLDE
jgi:iron complex transport system ATP-binding protein